MPGLPLPAIVLSLAIFCSAFLHARAKYRGPPWRIYLFKPLTTLLLIALAAEPIGGGMDRYRQAILIGLGLSLAGDILLMLPRSRFAAGLGFFLLAHLAYLTAFTRDVGFLPLPWLGAPLALAGALLLRALWPFLTSLKLPILLYVLVVVTMASQASQRAAVLGVTPAVLAAIGSVAFLGSDAVLAWNRFRSPFRSAPAVVTASYVLAQYLIALSAAEIGRAPPGGAP